MSTRACRRFIDPDPTDPEVVTVYKHSDGYPEGAVCWITKALENAWPLPRFEADEFAAAFVAANKPSAAARQMDYIAKAERENDPEKKLPLLKAAEEYGPGGRYADCVGGGVRLVNQPGLDAFKTFATDIAYLYDVAWKGNQLHVTAYATDERNGSWMLKRIFTGSLREMQEQYGLKYLYPPRPDALRCAGLEALKRFAPSRGLETSTTASAGTWRRTTPSPSLKNPPHPDGGISTSVWAATPHELLSQRITGASTLRLRRTVIHLTIFWRSRSAFQLRIHFRSDEGYISR